MNKTRVLEELEDLYAGRGGVIQTATGFELTDKATGIIFVLPKMFRAFIDGRIIDPVRFLTLPYYVWNGLLERCMEPLTVECICGKVIAMDKNSNEIRFAPADLGTGITGNNAVLIKAHWDMVQGVADDGWDDWIKQYYGQNVIWSFCETNDYRSAGDWYWLIQANPGDVTVFELYMVLAYYVRTLLGVYNLADEMAKDFEQHKVKCREQIMECLNRLPGRIHWVTEFDITRGLQGDANWELWNKNESDWHIFESEDAFEIRSRGSSPGVVAVELVRFDEIGLLKCLRLEDATKR